MPTNARLSSIGLWPARIEASLRSLYTQDAELPLINICVFRALYCTGIAMVFAHEVRYAPYYRLAEGGSAVSSLLLLLFFLSLAFCAVGIHPRAMALAAAVAFYAFVDPIAAVRGFMPNRIALVIPTLLAFTLISHQDIRHHRVWLSQKVPRWQVNAFILILAAAYFQSAYSKLYVDGLAWVSGDAVLGQFGRNFLATDNPVLAFLLNRSSWRAFLCSACLAFEFSFFLVLFNRRLAPFFAVFGLGMHLGIYLILNIDFFTTFGLNYLVFIDFRGVWSLVKAKGALK